MRCSTFIHAALLSASAVVGQITVTSWNAAQQSAIVSDLATLFSGITTRSDYSSVASVLATATVTNNLVGQTIEASQGIAEFNSIITGTPAWLASLPTGVQSWFSSVAGAEASIINRDASDAPKLMGRSTVVVGAVLAAGVGIVLVL